MLAITVVVIAGLSFNAMLSAAGMEMKMGRETKTKTMDGKVYGCNKDEDDIEYIRENVI